MAYVRTLKRIRQNKTNYRKRASLLMSRRSFLTVKISNQNVSAQVLNAALGGDKVLASAHSKQLLNYGWKGSLKNIPACYLTGLILAKKSIGNGIRSGVLYTGTNPFTDRVAACLKGVIDAGMDIPVSEDSFPSYDRLRGMHIAEYAKLLKGNREKYETKFSHLLKQGIIPEDYPEYVEEIKQKLLGGAMNSEPLDRRGTSSDETSRIKHQNDKSRTQIEKGSEQKPKRTTSKVIGDNISI